MDAVFGKFCRLLLHGIQGTLIVAKNGEIFCRLFFIYVFLVNQQVNFYSLRANPVREIKPAFHFN